MLNSRGRVDAGVAYQSMATEESDEGPLAVRARPLRSLSGRLCSDPRVCGVCLCALLMGFSFVLGLQWRSPPFHESSMRLSRAGIGSGTGMDSYIISSTYNINGADAENLHQRRAHSAFSDVECIGGHIYPGLHDTDHMSGTHARTCYLQNVCFNALEELVLYSDPSLPSPPLSVSNGIYVDLPYEWVSLRRYEKPHRYRSARVLRQPIPNDVVWASAAVHVLYHQYWPENFGHVLGDDVYPAWQILHRFGLMRNDVQMLAWKPCWFSGFTPDSDAAQRACRITKELFAVFSSRPWEHLKDFIDHSRNVSGSQPASRAVVCVERLVMGHALQGMGWQGANWPHFMNAFVRGFPADVQKLRPSKMQILVIKKTNRRKITNFDEMVLHLQDTLGVNVVALEPDKLALVDQVRIVRQFPVLITPCGGISFISPFLYPGSSVIFIDYFHPAANRTEFMEEFLWQHDVRLHRYHYWLQKSDVTGLDTESKLARLGDVNITEWEWYRHYPIHHIEPERMAYFALHAMLKAGMSLKLPQILEFERVMNANKNFAHVPLAKHDPEQVTFPW